MSEPEHVHKETVYQWGPGCPDPAGTKPCEGCLVRNEESRRLREERSRLQLNLADIRSALGVSGKSQEETLASVRRKDEEIAGLRAVLERYGRHEPTCSVLPPENMWQDKRPRPLRCDCGLAESLKGAAARPKGEK